MNLPQQESVREKTERLQALKERAQEVLGQYQESEALDRAETLEVTTLLENLRIYQVELELQNDELRAAQMTAEQAQRSYRTLFDQMPLPALVLDTAGLVDEANELAYALLDARDGAAKFDGRFWLRLSRPDRTRLHVALRDVMPSQTQVLERVELLTKDAPNQVFDAHLIGLSIDYKLDRRILLLLVDRSVERARDKERRLYNALLDATDNFIFATAADGRMLLANQAMLSSVQRPRAHVVGQRRENFMPLRDAILQNEADKQVLHTGQPMTAEQVIHLLPGNNPADFLTHRFPLLDASGQAYGVGGISTNVSALKNHQRQILLSESVFMSSDEGIIITDPQSRIIRVNPAF